MLVYLVRQRRRRPIETFLQRWSTDLADRVTILPYETLARRRRLPGGRFVFTDFERLTPIEFRLARELETRLPPDLIVNRPSQWLSRPALLRKLYALGWNRFNVFRADDNWQHCRFPVFIRHAHLHSGSCSDLLYTPNEVRAAIHRTRGPGHRPAHLLITEFLNTADQTGLFRKYAAFRVADRIIPRHLIFADHWMQKQPDLLDPAKLDEEAAYLQDNPHAERLMRAFELSGVEYGRIDYALIDGEVQVWEINTNPVIMLPPEQYAPEHLEHQRWFAARIGPALSELANVHAPRPPAWRPQPIRGLGVALSRLTEWLSRQRRSVNRRRQELASFARRLFKVRDRDVIE